MKNLAMAHERQKKQLTQLELGRICGIPETRVCKIETRRLLPGLEEARKIAGVLEKPLEVLFGEDGIAERSKN